MAKKSTDPTIPDPNPWKKIPIYLPACTPCSWPILYTVCPRSSDPFYVVTYYSKLVTTSWAYSKYHGMTELVDMFLLLFDAKSTRSLVQFS